MELETVPPNRRRQNTKTAAVSIPVLFAAQVARTLYQSEHVPGVFDGHDHIFCDADWERFTAFGQLAAL
jgi:hypothetical protein